jgi:polysaccharide pyruvyl transferase CsaB
MLSAMATPQAAVPQVLLCGYYGEHNLGDDALLEVLLQQLPGYWRPLVTAHDGAQLQARFGVETVARRSLPAVLAALARSRALVLGGGSLLQDSTSFTSLLYYGALITAARLQGKPVVFWGQGLGPLRRRRARLLVRALLPMASAIRWRDPASAALAAQLGRQDPTAADPVWASEPQPWRGGGGPVVVCFRPTHQLQGQQWHPYLDALERLARSADREVLWVPFHSHQDQGLLGQLRDQGLLPAGLAARSREVQPLLPREAKAIFATAGLVVAMRLHGLILAAVSGAPCAALSYDPKVEAAAAALGCGCQLLDPVSSGNHDTLVQALLQQWQGQIDRPPAATRLQALRQDAQALAPFLEEALLPA